MVAVVGRLGVRLAAFSLANGEQGRRSLSREIYSKTDAVLAGMWVGVMGVNALPSTAMLMIICLNLMGAGGPVCLIAGLVLMVVSCLVTLELTGITVSFNSAPLEWWLSFPLLVIYPLLFGWVSYQTAAKLAEHKRRLRVMSTRDGSGRVITDVIGKLCYAVDFDNCRRRNRDATLLIIDIDHFKASTIPGAMMWVMKRL